MYIHVNWNTLTLFILHFLCPDWKYNFCSEWEKFVKLKLRFCFLPRCNNYVIITYMIKKKTTLIWRKKIVWQFSCFFTAAVIRNKIPWHWFHEKRTQRNDAVDFTENFLSDWKLLNKRFASLTNKVTCMHFKHKILANHFISKINHSWCDRRLRDRKSNVASKQQKVNKSTHKGSAAALAVAAERAGRAAVPNQHVLRDKNNSAVVVSCVRSLLSLWSSLVILLLCSVFYYYEV